MFWRISVNYDSSIVSVMVYWVAFEINMTVSVRIVSIFHFEGVSDELTLSTLT